MVEHRNYQLREATIEQSSESLNRFVEKIESSISNFKKNINNDFTKFLKSVVENRAYVPVSSFRKAEAIYFNLLSSLDNFWVVFKEDQISAQKVARDLKFLISKRRDLKKQKNMKMVQVMNQLKRMNKQIKAVKKEYRDMISNFMQLQSLLSSQVIIYTSLKGKEFKILMQKDRNEFLKELRLEESDEMLEKLNKKFVGEFKRKRDDVDDSKLLKIQRLLDIYSDEDDEMPETRESGERNDENFGNQEDPETGPQSGFEDSEGIGDRSITDPYNWNMLEGIVQLPEPNSEDQLERSDLESNASNESESWDFEEQTDDVSKPKNISEQEIPENSDDFESMPTGDEEYGDLEDEPKPELEQNFADFEKDKESETPVERRVTTVNWRTELVFFSPEMVLNPPIDVESLLDNEIVEDNEEAELENWLSEAVKDLQNWYNLWPDMLMNDQKYVVFMKTCGSFMLPVTNSNIYDNLNNLFGKMMTVYYKLTDDGKRKSINDILDDKSPEIARDRNEFLNLWLKWVKVVQLLLYFQISTIMKEYHNLENYSEEFHQNFKKHFIIFKILMFIYTKIMEFIENQVILINDEDPETKKIRNKLMLQYIEIVELQIKIFMTGIEFALSKNSDLMKNISKDKKYLGNLQSQLEQNLQNFDYSSHERDYAHEFADQERL